MELSLEDTLAHIDKASDSDLVTSFYGASSLTKQQTDTFTFCSYLILALEREIQKLLVTNLKKQMMPSFSSPELIDFIFDQLEFGKKIKVFKECFKSDNLLKVKYEPFINFCDKVNGNIRNYIFHNKIDQATYKNQKVIDSPTRRKIVREFLTILENHKKFSSDMST